MVTAAEPFASRAPDPPGGGPRIPELSGGTVRQLVADMNRNGVAVVPGYLIPEDLQAAQRFVGAAVERSGGEYVVFNGKDAVGGTIMAALAESDAFNRLVRRVWELGTGRPAPDQRLHQVLRCLAGESGRREAYIFHFDSYVVSALLPIRIPERGQRGHLVMAPNVRGVRPLYLLNLLDKLLVDNKLTQLALRRMLRAGLAWFRRVPMVPGNLYLFWGYRSLHTNEPCDPGAVRSTALYHFGDPHAASPLRRRMGRVVV